MEKLTITMAIAIVGLVLTNAWQYFGVILKLKDDLANGLKQQSNDFNSAIQKQNETFNEIMQRQNEKLNGLCVSVGRIEEHDSIFWESIKARAIDSLKTYPTNLNLDTLLDKFKENVLTLAEAEDLRTALDCELMKKKENQWGYILIIARLKQIINDMRKEQGRADGERVDAVT